MQKMLERKAAYDINPKRCSFCGEKIPFELKHRSTCSMECCLAKRSHIGEPKRQYVGKHVVGRHIVYKVINDFDDRYYIGVRKTDDDEQDDYLGSGIHIVNMVKFYGKKHFKRITLFEFNNSTDAYNKEKELIAKYWGDKNLVNIAKGGQGGSTFSGRKHTDQTKKLLSDLAKLSHKKKTESLSD